MAHHCQLSPSMHLVSGPLGLWQIADSRCTDKPAPHHYPPSAASTNPTRACLQSQPCPGHLLGSLQALEGPNAPASSARQSLVLARSAVGPASSVTWGVGLGQPASSSVGGQTSGPTLTAHQVFCHQAPIGPERFDLPPTPFADANIGAISG